MNQKSTIVSLSFENTKKCLLHTLVILFLNSVTILLVLGEAEHYMLALIPSVLTIPLLTRLCWLFGQEIRRLAALFSTTNKAYD